MNIANELAQPESGDAIQIVESDHSPGMGTLVQQAGRLQRWTVAAALAKNTTPQTASSGHSLAFEAAVPYSRRIGESKLVAIRM
jgi:hypothetical protein